ncbi:hypothetical protein [Mucilaginibacter phyllosphaerae]|uniref:Uncharacterized protein n=1 Tax=Mucilaginibacter phyllosphaerae TaxID=1812349 RepID=A0A4Y8AC30_9SPHI|nr:hypothetical protein [Mucilaginibacter phyllosphaerae]MBB3969160.1 hypothetical protein [Mucilaginibacter phyllosphaerae]TEW66030.1 hypothetical protein E2R65_12970 [Mucilaginibacter phyllosphaerae]
METLNHPVTLTNTPPEHPGMDFAALRQEGINHLQHLAGNTWTDHNIHDPGITILDQLCYALTDLSYRISLDIGDLLARPGDDTYGSLFSPAQILTTSPVTITDFRKVLLDIPGVKNAWIEKITDPQPPIYFNPQKNTLSLHYDERSSADTAPASLQQVKIKGLYKVLISKSNRDHSDSNLLQQVNDRLQDCRGLCEDFEPAMIMAEEKITLKGTIEVINTEDVNRSAAEILYRLSSWLLPGINFYTLQQMLAKGKTVDEVMDGPALQHGFIDDDELNLFNRRPKLFASDLIREIMAMPEVRIIDNVLMSTAVKPGNSWILDLDTNRTPALDYEACLDSRNGLTFQKNGQVLQVNTEAVLSYLAHYKKAESKEILKPAERDIVPPRPAVSNLGAYYSIQNHFPQIYGIGETGLPESAPAERKAQAGQLKAYLLFFEQILANYFEQAAGLKDLFSFHNMDIKTYFHQSLAGKIPGVEELLDEKYTGVIADLTESRENALNRKDRFLNHLLARFGESLTDYSLWLNNEHRLNDGKLNANMLLTADPAQMEKERLESYKLKLVKDKLTFLQHYPAISSQRGKGFNYTQPAWRNENVSGLEKRIAGKLGINNPKTGSLTDNTGGFYMVEHILLRPMPADKTIVDRFMLPSYFSEFKKDKDGLAICTSQAHGLQNGEVIVIRDKDQDSSYTVSEVLVNSFKIDAAYNAGTIAARAKNGEPPLGWVRRDINSTIFAFTGEGEQGVVRDPYSFQLTFVFSDSNERFIDKNFRKFVESTIREETPAHLTVYIQWMADEALKRFESAYRVFLGQLEILRKP